VKLVTVKSSMIQAVGYDQKTRLLEVVFNSGQTFRYDDVPPSEYKGLMEAESKGRYMRDNTRSLMNPLPRGDITQLLIAWSNGDRDALNRLTPLVYDELRRIARSRLRQYGSDGLLQPTELVHEAYIKLIGENRIEWRNRAHFYAIAANTMRRILVNDLRKRTADKRGGDATLVSLDEGDAVSDTASVDLFVLSEAIEKLATLDERQARIIEMRFFGGMNHEEIAEAVGVSVATVKREWRAARAWLQSQLA
jgi:RNA polymerase sigma factor (TIGR02999 family)